jgi:cytochrome oxidase Cu insertion factor (SCO1/SenC/PrrC family)
MHRHKSVAAAALFVLAQPFGAADSFAQHAPATRGAHAMSATAAPAADRHQAPAPHTLGGPFELMDHTGQKVTDATYAGKWRLMFFGFAACREACPDALLTLTHALDRMGADADRIQPLFVDVGMGEPDPKGLANLLGNFHPSIVGLTGTRAQTFDVVRKFRVRREYSMNNYSSKETGRRLNHTTHFFLVDPEGSTQAYFSHRLTPEQMIAAIRRHLT